MSPKFTHDSDPRLSLCENQRFQKRAFSACFQAEFALYKNSATGFCHIGILIQKFKLQKHYVFRFLFHNLPESNDRQHGNPKKVHYRNILNLEIVTNKGGVTARECTIPTSGIFLN
jgi:hypothetical protein